MRARSLLALTFLIIASSACFGQAVMTSRAVGKQGRQLSAATPLPAALPVSAIKIDARIDNQVARVKVEHLFRNDTDQELEGTYYFPVPEGATLLEFAVYSGDERCAELVKERQEARASYSSAASQGEDPAILEMTRRGWFQARVYPIPPHSEKRVELIYSHNITEKEGLYTFEYPLGQGYKKLRVPVGEVQITLALVSDVAIRNVFSPTHPLNLRFEGDCHVTGKLTTIGGG
ncbi:MAG TPA: VIT domain-containing protein, partial [Blastocatellia bacterium]|nr:VIT domain-containing protein [Blastocatellia bacterium]